MQKDFFDNYVYENLLPSEHILLDIKEQIDFSSIEKELKDLYDTDNGRTLLSCPEVLFKMLFLEFYYNLSDVEVAKQMLNYQNILPKNDYRKNLNQRSLKKRIVKSQEFIEQLRGKCDEEIDELLNWLEALYNPDRDKAKDENEIITSADTLQGHQRERANQRLKSRGSGL